MLDKGYTIYYNDKEVDIITYAKEMYDIILIKENDTYKIKCYSDEKYHDFLGNCDCVKCIDKNNSNFSFQ